MRRLLDESVPRRLRSHLPKHAVKTVIETGWGGVKNGALLRLASGQFDALITVDQNLPYQQNTTSLAIAVVVLAARSNTLMDLLPLIPGLESALARVEVGQCLVVK